MSITKNVFTLKKAYELIVDRQWVTYDVSQDPGTLWSFGCGSYGRLGLGDLINRSSPTQIPGNQWNGISVGGAGAFAMASKIDGTLWSWGNNNVGQLGLLNLILRSSPTQIPGTTWSNRIEAGDLSSAVIKSDGSLWFWGFNDYGRLGLNDTINRSSPTQVPGTQWCSISMSYKNSFALKTDGTLWSWGQNSDGNLGNNTINRASSPVQVPGTQWSSVASGRHNIFGIKTDGTLWAWGCGCAGSLGLLNSISRSSPTQIPGNNWVMATGGACFGHAIKGDNTLFSWGSNLVGGSGTIANIYTTYNSSPTQLPGTQWIRVCSSSSCHNLLRKSDGTLWSWGYNNVGQAGLNNVFQFSSPAQIPGNQWNQIEVGQRSSLAIKLT